MAVASTRKKTPTASKAGQPNLRTHLLQVTPRQAREILKHNAYPGQRPVRPHQVVFLQGLIERGHLRPGTLISFAVLKDETRYLINGQHTLTALAATTGGPVWLQVEEIVVDSLAEVGWLYNSYDRNLTRSLTDLYRADQSLHMGVELPITKLRMLGGAITLLADGFQRWLSLGSGFVSRAAILLKDTHLRFSMMASWSSEAAQWAADCGQSHSTRILLERAAVLSVALVTYRFCPDLAQPFWSAIARDSGLVEGQPTHTLLRFLRTTPARRYESTVYARYVASAWNAAVDGRSWYSCKALAPHKPLLLKGTPHTGSEDLVYLTRDGQVMYTPVPETTETGS